MIPETGVQSLNDAATRTFVLLKLALIWSVVPRMFAPPETDANMPGFEPVVEYPNVSEGAVISTPVVTGMFGNVAVSDEALLPKVPVSVAGPCHPCPTSTETFPDAVNASTQAEPVVQVPDTPTPGEEIFTPGNGMKSVVLLKFAENVVVVPLRASDPERLPMGRVKPLNGVHEVVLPEDTARLNEYWVELV